MIDVVQYVTILILVSPFVLLLYLLRVNIVRSRTRVIYFNDKLLL